MCLDENQIVALLEGTISVEERGAIDAHLDECDTCRHLVGIAVAANSGGADETLPSEEKGSQARSVPRGATLSRYLILEAVGAGGMGVVYAAYDPELDRKVAIKVLRPGGRSSSESQRSRVLREAQAMARLTHPNVVSVYDVGVANHQVFVVMEFVAGTTLKRWLAETPRSWREVLEVFRRAGLGVAAAHGAGLVHRDFKPDNVLIGSDGRVLVTDFGLARLVDDTEPASHPATGDALLSLNRLTRTGAIVGTPAYMAPEQVKGEAVDARSDLFSFCVALYEALHGERPFAGNTLTEIHQAIVAGRVREVSAKVRVPAWVREIVLQGLRAEPGKRPRSMDALIAALGRDPSGRRRRPLIAGVLVLVVAVAGFGTWRSVRAQSLVCKGADAKLAGVWDADRKQAISRALAASGKPWAEDTWHLVEGTLDRYTRDWVTMRTQACEATRVTREQSEALLDARMRCLDDRVEGLRALTDLLSTSHDKLIDSAARAAYGLSSLRACADADALLAPVPLPSDVGVRAQVATLRVELAKVKALKDLGRYSEGQTQAAELVARVRPVGYPPLEAEALLAWADYLDRNSNFPRAADASRDALWAAESGKDRKLAVFTLVQLVWVVGHEQAKQDAGHEYARHAAAILRGLGGDAELEAQLASTEGGLLLDEGHYEQAEKRFREALEKGAVVFGPDHPQYGVALANLGVAASRQDRYAEALALSERALAVYDKALGQHHPLYGQTLFNIADTLRSLGRIDEARSLAERALALFLEVLGPEDVRVASAENVLGLVANAQHRYADAVAHFEHALSLAERLRGPEHVSLALYGAGFGDALEGLGRHADALGQYRRAITIHTKNGGDPTLIARIEATMGDVLLAQNAPSEALELFERSLKFEETTESSPKNLADTRFGVAQALWASKGDRERARRLAAQAIAAYELLGPSAKDDLAKTRVWLTHASGQAKP